MISYGRHSINKNDIEAVTKVLLGDWLTTGPLVEQFETQLSQVVGASTIVVSSGTAALHAAYAAIGIKPGDEVITPPITFIATQATAALLGAKIVFADVMPDIPTIDPDSVESVITSRTKAIVVVDYAGHPGHMSKLREIATKHGVYLIEDAAHSLGSTYNKQPVGCLADITTFSFYPTKNITTGEGGAIASANKDLLEKARRFSRQGLIRNSDEFIIRNEGQWHQEVHEFGLNYRMPDILCALGISQLSRLNEFRIKRQEIFDRYNLAIQHESEFSGLRHRENVIPMWHLYPLLVSSEKRKKYFDILRSEGVGVQVNYLPAYRHPVFLKDNINPEQYPNSEDFYSREISLPIHPELTKNQQERIIETLLDLSKNE